MPTRPDPAHPAPLDLPADPATPYRQLIDAVISRFGPDSTILLATTTDEPHASIHRVDRDAPRSPRCRIEGTPLRVLAAFATDAGAGHAALEIAGRLGIDPCRLCRRCWRGTHIPQHDRARCFPRTPPAARRAHQRLSPTAVAVVAGLLAPAAEGINTEGIVAPDSVWEEIRDSFPVQAFRDWAAANADPDGEEHYNPDAGY